MQSHTHLFAILAFALVFLPMAFLYVRAVVGMTARQKMALVAVFATSLLFFSVRFHHDLYRGLDTVIYANMAKAFRSGIQAIRVIIFSHLFLKTLQKRSISTLGRRRRGQRRRMIRPS